jgi:hypothetical protein
MKAITDYWDKYYVTTEDAGDGPYHMCSLCANQGTIDTRQSAISPRGNKLGRINFCICPNGQALRKQSTKNIRGGGSTTSEIGELDYIAKAQG